MPVEQRGQVTHVKMESTGNRRSPCLGGSPAGFPWGGTSRMTREGHVRICERLGVKFPGSTRPSGNVAMVELGTHFASESAGLVTLHLQPGAPELYPDPPSIACYGRQAYPMHAKVTMHVLLGCKSHGCPASF
jgi:hypothetical protein